jgi:RimJ/RimL family protein N-acetyltransferase
VAAVEAPTLGNGTVTLRPHRAGDVAAVVEQVSDAESQVWLLDPPTTYTQEHARAHIARAAAGWRDGGVRTLAVDVDGRCAGQVSLRPDGRGGAQLGYLLSPWARGRGVMTAAVRLYLGWAFASWHLLEHGPDGSAEEAGPLQVVRWRAFVGNWPSRRVAWACGFTAEGRARGLLERRGVRRDLWTGSLLAGEELRPRSAWLDVPVVELGPVGDLGDVVLRPYRPGDVPRVAQACSDAGTAAFLPNLPSPYTQADAAAFVATREEEHAAGAGVHWAIARAADGELLGAVSAMGLAETAAASAELGYWAHPDARGRGVMTAAARAAARHCLLPRDDGGLGLRRVLVRAASRNAASRAVARKAGFTEVGRDRDAERLRDGSLDDLVRHDLLARELGPTSAG